MLQYDFENSVGYWLTLTTHAYHLAFNDELAPHGVTYRQAQVLGLLALEGELTQSELAARMTIEPPSLVGVLDRMERSGWIARHACAGDRRKKIIRANPAAAPAWKKIVACARKVRRRAMRGLSNSEAAQLKKLLNRVKANVESRGGPSSIANGRTRRSSATSKVRKP